MLAVRLLGQFDLQLDDEPVEIASRPAQSLLAYLTLSAGTWHRREQLAGIFWPDTAEANARSNLRHALWRIRKALRASRDTAHEYLIVDDIAVTFDANADYWLDAAVLSRDLGQGASADEWIAAVSVYRGELLPGFYDEWAVLERERLRAVFDQKMQGLLNCLVEEQRWGNVSSWAERWIALDGSPELAYRALMIAYAGLGDASGVVAVYRRCVAALRDELGVEPSEQTRALFEQLRQGSRLAPVLPSSPSLHPRPGPVVDHQAPAPGEPPFKGLQYFDQTDADLFFGRERSVARLVARLGSGRTSTPALPHAEEEAEGHGAGLPTLLSPQGTGVGGDDQAAARFLAVVGASGSGKSSLVRAGLIPALKRGQPLADGTLPPDGSARWRVHVITPTAHPLEALAASLTQDAASVINTASLIDDLAHDPRSLHLAVRRSSHDCLLLVVDQFEELFTLCRSETERKAFVDNLVTAASPQTGGLTVVVITLRADFYPHCARFANLRELLALHQEFIGPMNATELRRAIEEPARQGGWDFEPGLVDLLLHDVGDEPGALPLLSHALLETWLRRRGRRITFGGYAESGGVHGAITHTAETVFNQRLTPGQQSIARSIFLRLTELGEGTQDTRRRVALDELVPEFQDPSAVEAVLTMLADARLITIAEGTVEVAHEALIRQWPALRQWLSEDREGLRLHRHLTEAAQEWDCLGRDWGELYRGTRLVETLEWAESRRGSLNALEREFLDASQDAARKEAAEREARRQRELEAAQQLAEAERRRAEEQSRMAGQLNRRAMWLAGVLLVAAVLLIAALASGLAAVRSGQQASLNADRAAREARTARSREWAAAAINSLDADPERSVLLALQAISETYGYDKTVLPEAMDALHLAVPASRVALTLVGHDGAVTGIAFSPDGGRVATSSLDKTLKVWDARTGQLVRTVVAHISGANTVAFSPDGHRLLSGGVVSEAKLWDAATGERLLTVANAYSTREDVNRVAFSPDGRRFATASSDGTARLWDALTGQQVLTITRGINTSSRLESRVLGVAFSPDGTRFATANSGEVYRLAGNATAQVWDAQTGRNLLTLTGHTAPVNAVVFSPDGTRLATASDDGTARLWNASTGDLEQTLVGHTAEVVDVAFSPDGARVATASLDRTAVVWDVASGKPLMTLSGHRGGITGVAFSADGSHLGTSSQDGTARIWELSAEHEVSTIAAHAGRINTVVFSPDGAHLATAGQDGAIKVWDVGSGRELLDLEGRIVNALDRYDLTASVAFSPDGTHLVTSGLDRKVAVRDAASGREILSLPAPFGASAMALSPDGTRLATVSGDMTVGLWDTASGQPVATLAGHTARIDALAFSPDGIHAATGSRDGELEIWNIATGETLFSVSAHRDIIWAVAFSPDGRRFATASRDATAKIWDSASGRLLRTLSGHSADIRGIAFSPDGMRLATASADGTCKLWDTTSGEELYTLSGQTGLVASVAFSPNGKYLATGGQDGMLRLYALDIEDLLAVARARVTRTLTADECLKYLHMEQCPTGH